MLVQIKIRGRWVYDDEYDTDEIQYYPCPDTIRVDYENFVRVRLMSHYMGHSKTIYFRGKYCNSLILDNRLCYSRYYLHSLYVRNFVMYKKKIGGILCSRWILPLKNPLIHRRVLKIHN